MRILFVSDLHIEYENDEHVKWLFDLVKAKSPDIIISAGDNGELTYEVIQKLSVPFYTIYGNHDRPDILHEGSELNKVWLFDGLHVFKNGLRILAWNGIFGFRTDRKRRWYHRSLDSAVRLAFKYSKSRPHIFVSHEVPFYDFGEKRTQEYLAVMNFIVRMTKPVFWLNGHMHLKEPVTIDTVTFSPTVYVRVESSRRAKGYALLEYDSVSGTVSLVDSAVKQETLRKFMVNK